MFPEQGTHKIPLKNPMKYAYIRSIGNNHICSGTCGNLCRSQFCLHASGAHIAPCGSFCHGNDILIQPVHYGNQLCRRIFMRIIGKQSVNIRQQNQ